MKKAQAMGVPFQLIFSLILVAAVIVFGFFAIRMFLQRAEQAKFGVAFKEFEQEIQSVWQESGESNKTISVLVPKKVEAVCFVNRSASCRDPYGIYDFCNSINLYSSNKENFFFYPLGIAEQYNSKSAWSLLCQDHSCVKLSSVQCFFKNERNEVKIRLVKEYGDPLIKLYSA
ncbi:MAG: hypothetical protein QXW65_00090 [Candidatus Pacearchaeota archaeon]